MNQHDNRRARHTPTELLAGYLQIRARQLGLDESCATETFTFTDAQGEPDCFSARAFAAGVRNNLAKCPYKGYIAIDQMVNQVVVRMVPPPVRLDGPAEHHRDRPITTTFH